MNEGARVTVDGGGEPGAVYGSPTSGREPNIMCAKTATCSEFFDGRSRARTGDLLLVRQAL